MITVSPDVIPANGQASISHSHNVATTITITNDHGGHDTITVQPGQVFKWTPPAGWTEARFNDGDCPEVYRVIA